MCRPFSCIVKSDLSVLVGGHVAMHSHTQIIKHHGLPQEVSVDQYARVELLPENDKYGSDPATWKLNLDQCRVPAWWKENQPEISDRVIREAQKWQAKIFQLAEFKVEDDDFLICCDSSTPQIMQSGGELWTCGSSRPQIMQSKGLIRTFGSSRPQIIQSGGEVWTYGSSRPQIMQSNGVVKTYDNSSQQIMKVEAKK